MNPGIQELEDQLEGMLARPSQQKRSQEKTDRLVREGYRLLAKHGFDGMTVAELTRCAEVPLGTFYQRFPDKEAFLAFLHLKANQTYRASLSDEKFFEKLAKLEVEKAMERFVEQTLQGYINGEEFLKEVLPRATGNPLIKEPLRIFGIYIRRQLAEALRPHYSKIGHPKPELAAQLLVETYFGLLNNIVIYDAGPLKLRSRELKRELLRMARQYLDY